MSNGGQINELTIENDVICEKMLKNGYYCIVTYYDKWRKQHVQDINK